MDLSILQSLENARCGFLTALFSVFTFLGEETFLILAIALVYWALNKRAGEFLIYSVLMSTAFNGVIKDAVKRPRPYVSGGVSKVEIDNFFVSTAELDNSYSFPSGHSQNGGAFFSSVIINFKNRPLRIACAAAILLIMLSRLYLGVHYPTDVLAGAAMGIAFSLITYLIYSEFYEKRGWIFLVAAVLFCACLFFAGSEDTFKAAGSFLGAAAGLLLEQKFVNFDNDCVWWKKTLRIILGIALVLGLRVLLKLIFPAMLIFDFIRYFAMIFSMTGLYPFLFKKLGF